MEDPRIFLHNLILRKWHIIMCWSTPFTVGRKNWLFSASPKGAASSAIVYTMVEMAKANDLNTYKYLTYLLSQRPDAKMSDEQLEQLAPWSETAKANCQN